jgi:hypothetical protein
VSGFVLGAETVVSALEYEKIYEINDGKSDFIFRFSLGPFSYDMKVKERLADNTLQHSISTSEKE